MSGLNTETIQAQQMATAQPQTNADQPPASNEDRYLKARKVVELMPDEQRSAFMNRFKSLDETKKETVIDRLLASQQAPAQASQAPEAQAAPSQGKASQPSQESQAAPQKAKAGVDTGLGMFPGQKIVTTEQGGTRLKQRGIEDVPGAIVDTFTNYALGLARGSYAGAESFYRTLDGLDKIQAKVTGLGPSNFFAKSADNLEKTYKALPRTSFDPITETVFELAGRAPADVAQFAATRGALTGIAGNAGKAVQTIAEAYGGAAPKAIETMGMAARNALAAKGISIATDAAAIGVTQAMSDYSKNQDLQSAGNAFKQGAAVGVAIPAAVPFVQSAMKAMATLGRNAAKGYIQFVTGSKEVAEDFVKNPQKFNTNLFKGTPSLEEFKLASQNEQTALKAKHDAERLQFRQNEVDGKAKIQEQMNLSRERMQDSVRGSEQKITEINKEALDNLVEKNSLALEQFDQSSQDKYTSIFDNFGQKVKMLRKQTGEAVGNALDKAVELDPLIALPAKSIQGRVYSVINDLSPFKKVGSKFLPVVDIADQKDVNTFNAYMQQFNHLASEGKLSIQFLQESKNALGNLASKYYSAGDGRLGALYQAMGKELNPVNLLDTKTNSWLWSKQGTAIDARIQDIANANRGYYELMGKYDRAMKYYFEESPTGDLMPKQKIVTQAIEKNDVAILRQMKIADTALAKDDQVLPQVGKLLQERDGMMDSQKAIVKNLKRRLNEEKILVKQANRETQRDLALNQGRLSAEQTKQAQRRLFDFNQRVNSEQSTMADKLNTQEVQLMRQEALRSVIARSPAGRILQYGAAGFGGFTKNPALLAMAGASSPIVAANLTKAGVYTARGMNKLVGQRFGRIADALNENLSGGAGNLLENAIAGKTSFSKAARPAAELGAGDAGLQAFTGNADASEIKTSKDTTLKGLNKEFKSKLQTFNDTLDNEGIKVRVTSAYRSPEQQEKLYAQGRTSPGKIVTSLRHSRHNDGMAVDVVVLKNGKVSYAPGDYKRIGEVAKKLGLRWGGDFKKLRDYGHIEIATRGNKK